MVLIAGRFLRRGGGQNSQGRHCRCFTRRGVEPGEIGPRTRRLLEHLHFFAQPRELCCPSPAMTRLRTEMDDLPWMVAATRNRWYGGGTPRGSIGGGPRDSVGRFGPILPEPLADHGPSAPAGDWGDAGRLVPAEGPRGRCPESLRSVGTGGGWVGLRWRARAAARRSWLRKTSGAGGLGVPASRGAGATGGRAFRGGFRLSRTGGRGVLRRGQAKCPLSDEGPTAKTPHVPHGRGGMRGFGFLPVGGRRGFFPLVSSSQSVELRGGRFSPNRLCTRRLTISRKKLGSVGAVGVFVTVLSAGAFPAAGRIAPPAGWPEGGAAGRLAGPPEKRLY